MFFSDVAGVEFQPFGFLHILFMILVILGSVLIYIYRDWLRNHPKERWIAVSLVLFGLFWELALYVWKIAHSDWTWYGGIPFFSLCGMTLYVGMAALLFKNFRLFEIGYFWTWGAIASVLFPDILHSYDRFRFYQFMFGHMAFFYMFIYMIFIYRWRVTWKSFQLSTTTLFVIAILYTAMSNLTGENLMFMLRSDGTPLSMFEGGPYIFYVIGTIVLSFVVMAVWMVPFHVTSKQTKSVVQ